MEYTQIHEIINIPLITKMINEGFDVNAYDRFGSTPLHYCDNTEVANILLANGADLDKRSLDRYRVTPIEGCDYQDVKEIYLKHLSKSISVD